MKLPDFALERYFDLYEFELPHLLGSSDIEPYRVPELLELADGRERELWESLSLGYTESAGHPLLREEIAGLYEAAEPDDVLVFAGAKEAIFAYMNVALGAGDLARLPVATRGRPRRRSGGNVAPAAPRDGLAAGGRRAAKCGGRQNTGGSGQLPPQPDRRAAGSRHVRGGGARAGLRGPALLGRGVPAARARPGRPAPGGRGPARGGGEPRGDVQGLRAGGLADRLDLHPRPPAAAASRRLQGLHHDLQLRPSEILALIALRARNAVLDRNMEIISGNLRHADRFFDEWRDTVEWARPHAGCTGFPKLLQGPFAEDLAARLASEEGVMLLPGEVYGYPGHFRLGFGRRDFPEALEKLERFFERRMRTGGGV